MGATDPNASVGRCVSAAEDSAATRLLVERHGLWEFVRQFWHESGEGRPFVDGWAIGAICAALMAVSLRQITKLVINVPPGVGKSLLTSVFWPAWQWSWDPGHRWMFTSYELGIVGRDAAKMLSLVQSERYRLTYPGTVLTSERPAVHTIHTKAGGLRYSKQLRGGLTGWHGDTLVCDDPIKPDEALRVTGLQLEEVSRIWKNTAATRRMDPARHASVIIMQRLAEDDLAGEMLREQGYEHLCLPMRYVPGCTWDFGCSLGKLDQRTEAGELLAPQRFPESAVQELEAALETEQNVGAQLQQNPVPKRGAFFEDDWFGTWEALPARPRYVQSWDLGFKGKRAGKQQRQAHSRVHGALWAFTDAAYYLVAEVIGWWNYPETRRQFQRCQTLWAKCEAVLVEDKANGPALIDEMAELSPGVPIKPVEPQGSKEDRASRHSALAESGKILLPTAEQMPTIGEFRAELVRFPNQRRNDRVDTTTQALDYMTDKAQRLRAALHAIGKNR